MALSPMQVYLHVFFKVEAFQKFPAIFH